MSKHECIIGNLYDDGLHLATLKELKDYIKETKEYNLFVRNSYPSISQNLLAAEYTLKDYCDKRKSTNLTRFEFCPYCGKKIDWKKIKEGKEE